MVVVVVVVVEVIVVVVVEVILIIILRAAPGSPGRSAGPRRRRGGPGFCFCFDLCVLVASVFFYVCFRVVIALVVSVFSVRCMKQT